MARLGYYMLTLTVVVPFALAASNADEPVTNIKESVLSRKDLVPAFEGKEVTMVIKVTDTQLIAGDREGQFPHVKLHHEFMGEAPYLLVYAKGDVADALHRFACVAPDSNFEGRTIRASGKLRIETGVDKISTYVLELRDWKKFQILREPK